MNKARLLFCAMATTIVCVALTAGAKDKDKEKDKEIPLTAAPAGVQATIKKVTDAGATLEKVEREEESGGTQFGAKITDKNGVRWEIIMDANGTVVKTDQKKAKK